MLRRVPDAATPTTVDPLAVSYLTGLGLSPSEVASWTTGSGSQPAKAASCFAMLEPVTAPSTRITGSGGSQWGDAGIGAGATLGLVLLPIGAAAGLVISRQNRRQPMARA